jgi:predicted phosphodiesterase
MRILHLSDLHRGDSETLKSIWGGPQSALRKLPASEQRFDFIVVSGDLSETARPSEYDELLEFTTGTLAHYLREPEDRRRLIFVPGNHDVDWSADLGEPLELAALLETVGGPESLERHLRRYRDDPARSGIRQRISRFGHIEWLRLDEAKQANRFRNVQRFLGELYGDSLSHPCRRFDLIDPREGHDWSAHIFPEEQVAFVGFNSCFMNDRYWVGAAISRQSIAHATNYLHEHADGCLRIAVWHHGVHTDSYRPDYLNQADIGELIISGFQVGFHGHTHKASSEQLDWLTDRFVIVSTGSVGANQHHRPDAVGRQFSIARLYPHQAYVQVYERGGDISAYVRKRARTFSLLSPTEKDHREVTADLHRRAYAIKANGTVTVDVELTEFQSPRPVVLAEVPPPVIEDAEALTNSPGFEIRRTRQDGTVRFTLYPLEYRPNHLTWSYGAANAIPLNRAEVPLYEANLRHRRSPDASRSGSIIQTHLVAFPCKRLDLSFRFDSDEITPCGAAPQVERLTDGPGEPFWERVPAEEERCVLEASGRRFSLAIEAPIVGYRYGVAFEPCSEGAPLDYMPARIATKLIERCLDDKDEPQYLALLFHEAIAGALAAVFNAELKGLTWRGLIWDSARQRLCTSFGAFPNRQWAVSFAYGAGVAGQAFRFNRVGASCQPQPGLRGHPTLLSQSWRAEWGALEHDDWAVGVPIIGDPDRKHAIGVVHFEGATKSEGFGSRLREFANAALARRVTGTFWEEFIDDLSTAVNTGFWQACTLSKCLGDYQSHVDELILKLGLGPVDDS